MASARQLLGTASPVSLFSSWALSVAERDELLLAEGELLVGVAQLGVSLAHLSRELDLETRNLIAKLWEICARFVGDL